MTKRIVSLLLFCIFSVGVVYSQALEGATFAINTKHPNARDRRIVKLSFDTNLIHVGDDRLAQFGGISLSVKNAEGVKTIINLRPDQVSVQGGNPKILLIEDLEPDLVIATAKTFELSITQLQFETEPADIETSGNVVDVVDYKKSVLKLQKEAFDKAKPTENKNFYGGFSFATADGAGTDGNSDLVINVPLKFADPRLFVTLNLKKSSEEAADPKQFDLGFAYRRTFILPGIKKDLRNAIRSGQFDQVVNTHNRIQSKRFLLGFLTEFSGRIEGEAMNFNTTNAVVDVMPFQIMSRVKRLGTNDVFMKFHFIPGGFEFGRNLRTENEVTSKYYISRFKIGGEFALTYDPRNKETSFLKRAELNLRGINRYLFRNETAFDTETDTARGISKGNKFYFTAEFKAFFTETAKGRFGFRVSRMRGSLPPTFNGTSSFTYGLVFESAEDENATP